MDNLVLINKDHGIDINYVPSDLVVTDNNENNFHKYLHGYMKPQVKKEVFLHFCTLREEAKKDGLDLIIDSGYRSSEYQKEIWNMNFRKNFERLKKEHPDDMIYDAAVILTNKYVALPGHSEHQSGLAIDFACFRSGVYSDELKNSPESEWLYLNAYKYGFILRYPLGKEEITGYNFEPWHYRYVGDCSYDFFDGYYLTLEEYHKGLRLIRK